MLNDRLILIILEIILTCVVMLIRCLPLFLYALMPLYKYNYIVLVYENKMHHHAELFIRLLPYLIYKTGVREFSVPRCVVTRGKSRHGHVRLVL